MLRVGFVATITVLQIQAPFPVYGLQLAMFSCVAIAIVLSINYFRNEPPTYRPYNLDFLEGIQRKDPLDMTREKTPNRGYVRADGRYSMLYL